MGQEQSTACCGKRPGKEPAAPQTVAPVPHYEEFPDDFENGYSERGGNNTYTFNQQNNTLVHQQLPPPNHAAGNLHSPASLAHSPMNGPMAAPAQAGYRGRTPSVPRDENDLDYAADMAINALDDRSFRPKNPYAVPTVVPPATMSQSKIPTIMSGGGSLRGAPQQAPAAPQFANNGSNTASMGGAGAPGGKAVNLPPDSARGPSKFVTHDIGDEDDAGFDDKHYASGSQTARFHNETGPVATAVPRSFQPVASQPVKLPRATSARYLSHTVSSLNKTKRNAMSTNQFQGTSSLGRSASKTSLSSMSRGQPSFREDLDL